MEDIAKLEIEVPGKVARQKVDWRVSAKTKAIVSAYAAMAERPEEEIVDYVLAQLWKSEKLRDFVRTKRNNKRWLAAIEGTLADEATRAETLSDTE